jgi:hypothetical protein
MRPIIALVMLIGLALLPPIFQAHGKRAERIVELREGQSAPLADNVMLRFDKVALDSRCPIDVTCVWAGEAKLQFALRKASQKPKEFVLTAPLADEAEVEGWRIKFISLLPPRTSKSDGARPAYVVNLSVTGAKDKDDKD